MGHLHSMNKSIWKVKVAFTTSNYKENQNTFMVYLDFGKLEGKKKNLKSSFLSIVWFEKSQKEKK